MCTANMQAGLPDFMTNVDGTTVTPANGPNAGKPRTIGESKPMTAETIPLGDGLADAGRNALLKRREEIRRAVNGGG